MPGPTLLSMIPVDEDALVRRLSAEGVSVTERRMRPTLWGYYVLDDRLIVINSCLRQKQRIHALVHETIHHLRADCGHQSQCVEDRIDEEVSTMLVDPAEYRIAEERYGWDVPSIALDLGLCQRTVRAYRRHLHRTFEL